MDINSVPKILQGTMKVRTTMFTKREVFPGCSDLRMQPEIDDSLMSESLPYAVTSMKLHHYFSHISNHSARARAFMPRMLSIFEEVNGVPSYEIIEEVNIDYTSHRCLEEENGHWDSLAFGDTNPELTDQVIKFSFYQTSSSGGGRQYKRAHCLYFIKSKSLICCDLTHSIESTDVLFRPVIDHCIERFGLDRIVPGAGSVPDAKPKNIKITLGCDPEFEYVRFADNTVCQAIPESIFSKKARKESAIHPEVEIGLDGSCRQVEIRPKPTTKPARLERNITKIMRKLKNVQLATTGHTFPLGCHLHFGVGRRWIPSSNLTMMLDDFLGLSCYPMNGNARGGYGELGGVRAQPHGFEYRSLPAAIMSDKKFFRIVLKIGKSIVDKYVNWDGTKPITYMLKRSGAYPSFIERKSHLAITGITDEEYDYYYSFINSYAAEKDGETTNNVVAAWIHNAEPIDIEKRDMEAALKKKAILAERARVSVSPRPRTLNPYATSDAPPRTPTFAIDEDYGIPVASMPSPATVPLRSTLPGRPSSTTGSTTRDELAEVMLSIINDSNNGDQPAVIKARLDSIAPMTFTMDTHDTDASTNNGESRYWWSESDRQWRIAEECERVEIPANRYDRNFYGYRVELHESVIADIRFEEYWPNEDIRMRINGIINDELEHVFSGYHRRGVIRITFTGIARSNDLPYPIVTNDYRLSCGQSLNQLEREDEEGLGPNNALFRSIRYGVAYRFRTGDLTTEEMSDEFFFIVNNLHGRFEDIRRDWRPENEQSA